MKAQWMDDDETKVVLTLDDGETFSSFTGPGSFQIVANDLNTDFAALEEQGVEIADPPEPAGLTDAQKEARAARRKAAEEQRANAKKAREETAKAAAAKPAEKPKANEHAAAGGQHAAGAQHGAAHTTAAPKK